ncbi:MULTISPECIES: hypothetical protein [unclassified Bradyrhizobium]|uniref:hypothetical protein n=1 Tax=unclassified Bradyrhizobium TaxID=2631580 RepID=UPI002A3888CB|nr:hypothetical protein [Bradyrhizobium sp. CW9]MCK1453152.1 hypothetical protein [Bradyrhizobium sp. 35]MCK1634657.1 hypothetical protein [Bradyrhizobium sp. 162]MCK1676070.1 hypothetical protein [Bradyrhizobium sp. 150]MCK1695111.1 hypothetical protein [Bradyrhizobium sp. 144]
MQGVEIGNVIDAKHYLLTLDDEVLLAVLQSGRGNAWVTLDPIRAMRDSGRHAFVRGYVLLSCEAAKDGERRMRSL